MKLEEKLQNKIIEAAYEYADSVVPDAYGEEQIQVCAGDFVAGVTWFMTFLEEHPVL